MSMQEVVCFNCGRIVHISPDAELCSVCSENLRELLHPVYASKYFYDRAAQLAAGAEPLAALREIDRGLGYQPSSELRLLGAILAQRIGDYEQMRIHVAAVPVDDVLRPEAEWLLRSHQLRQRDQRSATKAPVAGRNGGAPPLAALTAEPLPPLLLPTRQLAPAAAAPKRRTARAVIYTSILLLALGFGGVLVDRSTGWVGLWAPAVSNNPPTAPEIAEPVYQPPTAEPTTLSPTATALPTLQVEPPPDVVQSTPEAVAASTPGDAVAAGAAQAFDLQAYLTAQARPALAELQVSAARQDGVLILDGFVTSAQDRLALMALAQEIEGIETVNAVDLFVRLPSVYIVQAGDTLWDISYRFYGDNRIAEILAANRSQLASAEQLRVGMELQLPPFTP